MCPAKETKYYEELVAKHEKAFLQSVKTSGKYITYDGYEDLKEYRAADEYFWNKNGSIIKSLLPYTQLPDGKLEKKQNLLKWKLVSLKSL